MDTSAALQAELNRVEAERDKLRQELAAVPIDEILTLLDSFRPTSADELAALNFISVWLATLDGNR